MFVITETGSKLGKGDVPEVVNTVKELTKKSRKASVKKSEIETNEDSWKEELLTALKQMDPFGFEKLCKRILREAGFSKVQVTSKVHDKGIDGTGILKINLLSFKVAFQAKRYRDSVGAPEIQKFRGALNAGIDKGILITTGSFTSQAEEEARRPGHIGIDLINGEELCELLKKFDLGVSTELVEEVKVDKTWFDSF